MNFYLYVCIVAVSAVLTGLQALSFAEGVLAAPARAASEEHVAPGDPRPPTPHSPHVIARNLERGLAAEELIDLEKNGT